jgi:trehalose 6-phosphate phosphatase
MPDRNKLPRHLFSAAGQAALQRLRGGRPLLAFDFDGTLAPIAPRPEDVLLAPAVAADLRRLGLRWPVAVISGRAVRDLRPRLGFEPQYLVGCHGADDGSEAVHAWARPLREWCRGLAAEHAAELAAAGIRVEDKGAAVALHYRGTPEPARALRLLDALLAALPPALKGYGGKQVLNVVAADAPDKADALQTLLQRSGCDRALFAGDDLNDEPVFQRAPPQWLTVRVGPAEGRTRARFSLRSPAEVALLLARLADNPNDPHPSPLAS